MALSIEETFDKAAGYMWTPSEYPKKGADEDELAASGQGNGDVAVVFGKQFGLVEPVLVKLDELSTKRSARRHVKGSERDGQLALGPLDRRPVIAVAEEGGDGLALVQLGLLPGSNEGKPGVGVPRSTQDPGGPAAGIAGSGPDPELVLPPDTR